MADPSPFRDAVIADVERHMSEHGPTNWNPLLVKWSDRVSPATFWRCVATAKRKVAEAAILEEARRQIVERAAATTDQERSEALAASLPVSPSPDFLAKNGEQGVASLDLLSKFEELYDDAVLLRNFAMSSDGQKIRNPMVLRDSVALRDRLLQTALRAAEAVWNLRRQIEFYDLVVEEVAKASPEVAQAIMERLADLNHHAGMRP